MLQSKLKLQFHNQYQAKINDIDQEEQLVLTKTKQNDNSIFWAVHLRLSLINGDVQKLFSNVYHVNDVKKIETELDVSFNDEPDNNASIYEDKQNLNELNGVSQQPCCSIRNHSPSLWFCDFAKTSKIVMKHPLLL